MLSILIPVYNWEVTELALSLYRLCSDSGVDFEIRCYEDGSSLEYRNKNKGLLSYERIVYRSFEENVGRSRIRNRLAAEASYPFLLFLDCDSELTDEAFITNYLQRIEEGKILYGGRIYPPHPPENKARQLHWRYGHVRETASAAQRQRTPYHRFMTNNFLIPKPIFMQTRFEERLRQYGHEDTLFGQEMQARGIPIVHLDNPVMHIGLEEAGIFLEKNRQAMENLCLLIRIYPDLHTHLLRTTNRLKNWRLDRLVLRTLAGLYPLLQRNLLSDHPSLRALDLYKLYYFLKYDQQ